MIQMASENTAPAPVAGLNRSKKMIRNGNVKLAYVACDAEEKIIREITELCREYGVELDDVHTKSELGSLCGIEVDCAVCVVS